MMQPALATSPVEKALAESKILPKGYAFRVIDRDREATVQTYQSSKSPTITDMKIDAVLIGKIVTERLPKIAKVKVQFFKPDRSGYSQVLVTVGDITAYGLGGISKEKLLQSLETVRVASANLTPTEQASYTTFNGAGIKFMHPAAWHPEPMSGDGYIAKFHVPGAQNWANMLLRKQTAHSAEEQAGYDETWGIQHAGKTLRKAPVAVGNLTGFELLIEKPDAAGPSRYDRHVYFGKSDIYSLTLDCPAADAKKFGLTFAKILNSVEVQQ